ncbi:MAG: LytTR family transcriptional regulator DNA-binding domain-containing protein [Alcanivoracaceae bacterium]|nr:LytTR family transcriptional regulator DNA-binding domain-containing protein [Alcanivoracaceae bacterium]
MSNSKINLNKRYHVQLPSMMTVLINLCIGLVIGYLGPFGSYQIPLFNRLLYWVILIGAGHFIYFQTDRFCQWYFDKKDLNILFGFIVSSFIGAVFLSFFVEYISHYFMNLELAFPKNFLFFFPKVFVLGLTLNVLGYLIDHAKNNTASVHEVTHDQNNFINRIPHKLGSDLICFSMDDHYLLVYTEKGSHMMLLRMKDALVELKDYKGLQVHRSWWVAIDAVMDVKKQTRKATLIMKNNIEVPVSQKYLPMLKEAGLV